MTKELIKLQNAHVTQHTNGHIKSEWSVEENESNDVLGLFPSNINEETMFKILDFSKKFELEAFNVGISHGKKITVKVYDEKIKQFNSVVEELRNENERLASALDNEQNRGEEI